METEMGMEMVTITILGIFIIMVMGAIGKAVLGIKGDLGIGTNHSQRIGDTTILIPIAQV